MKLARRQALAGAAAGALGAAGVYEFVDQLTGGSPPRATTARLFEEQHLLDGVRTVDHEGVEVLVPPLHHEVLTARVAVGRSDLRDAQRALEGALAGIESDYAPSPAGVAVTVAWGLPYFEHFVPAAWERQRPWDRRAAKPALVDSLRFPSDPFDTEHERNHVAFLVRSDSREHVAEAVARIRATKTFELTSIRRGFAGGGFEGGRSLPKKMALAAGIKGADLIPDSAELFLGFTSTQRAGMGPGAIANFETLGYVDLRDSDYFRQGTHMHLSHIDEDVEAWYLNFDFRERVDTAFRPNLKVREGAQTVPQAPEDVVTADTVRRDFMLHGRIGHSAALQSTTRLAHDTVGADGTVYA